MEEWMRKRERRRRRRKTATMYSSGMDLLIPRAYNFLLKMNSPIAQTIILKTGITFDFAYYIV
jgi:hypothetical protein